MKSLTMKDVLPAVIFGAAGAAVIRIGLALWRGFDWVEAMLISVTSFAVIAIAYLIFFRSEKQA